MTPVKLVPHDDAQVLAVLPRDVRDKLKTVIGAGSTPRAIAGGYAIGSGGSLSIPMTGSMAEVISYNAWLTDAQCVQVEQYIRNWSVIY